MWNIDQLDGAKHTLLVLLLAAWKGDTWMDDS